MTERSTPAITESHTDKIDKLIESVKILQAAIDMIDKKIDRLEKKYDSNLNEMKTHKDKITLKIEF